jgi:hypothetical protein
LGESDEKTFRPADVAEPIRVFILDYFAYELGAALAEPFERLVRARGGMEKSGGRRWRISGATKGFQFF